MAKLGATDKSGIWPYRLNATDYAPGLKKKGSYYIIWWSLVSSKVQQSTFSLAQNMCQQSLKRAQEWLLLSGQKLEALKYKNKSLISIEMDLS